MVRLRSGRPVGIVLSGISIPFSQRDSLFSLLLFCMRLRSPNAALRASSSLQRGICRRARCPLSTRAAPSPSREQEEEGASSIAPSTSSTRRDLLLSSSSLLLLASSSSSPRPSLAAPLVDEKEAEAAISSASGSVVSVLAARRGPSKPLSPLCSGVAVLPGGVVATAAHALAAAAGSPLFVRIRRRDGSPGDLVFGASVIGTEPASDVALLRVDFSSSASSPSAPSLPPSLLLPPLPFGPSSSLKVGQALFVVAAPSGDGAPLATAGVVSGLKRAVALPQGSSAAAIPPLVTGCLQTDAPFAGAGWAGGAAVDSSGALVGIATTVRGGGGGGGFGGRGAGTSATGVGFALASDNVAAAVERIMR